MRASLLPVHRRRDARRVPRGWMRSAMPRPPSPFLYGAQLKILLILLIRPSVPTLVILDRMTKSGTHERTATSGKVFMWATAIAWEVSRARRFARAWIRGRPEVSWAAEFPTRTGPPSQPAPLGFRPEDERRRSIIARSPSPGIGTPEGFHAQQVCVPSGFSWATGPRGRHERGVSLPIVDPLPGHGGGLPAAGLTITISSSSSRTRIKSVGS
jgi:hypothetical protein